MNLARAVRLDHFQGLARVAFIGAGGKTTALFQLARELSRPASSSEARLVLVSATTHLAVEQLARADRHYFAGSPQDVTGLEGQLWPGVNLLTGPAGSDGRTAGLADEALAALLSLANRQSAPLLVEADGSRRRPLKAPAEHEPVVPEWVNLVIVVAGMQGVNKPLNEAWVHRMAQFAAISHLAEGAPITPAALVAVLASPQGGLKGIPPGTRRVLLLNQADTPQQQAQAQHLALELLPHYDSVLIASLEPPEQQRPGEGPVLAVHERVAGILLAAGGSSRMGRPKQLLEWQGEPLVRRAARVALAAGLDPVVVVTGSEADQVNLALQDLPVVQVYNGEWQAGQSTSVTAGVRALTAGTGAVIFLLVDQPQVTPALLHRLVEIHAETLAPLVAPQAGGRRANPVLFDRQTFPDLLALQGDAGGRVLFSRYQPAWLDWQDESLLLDIDTPEDYERMRQSTGWT